MGKKADFSQWLARSAEDTTVRAAAARAFGRAVGGTIPPPGDRTIRPMPTDQARLAYRRTAEAERLYIKDAVFAELLRRGELPRP